MLSLIIRMVPILRYFRDLTRNKFGDFIWHETRKQAHEISPGDLIPGGVLMMGKHGAEKKLALALSSPLVAHMPHWFNELQSAFLAFMNYSWDC